MEGAAMEPLSTLDKELADWVLQGFQAAFGAVTCRPDQTGELCAEYPDLRFIAIAFVDGKSVYVKSKVKVATHDVPTGLTKQIRSFHEGSKCELCFPEDDGAGGQKWVCVSFK
jgi:hypothetical protein